MTLGPRTRRGVLSGDQATISGFRERGIGLALDEDELLGDARPEKQQSPGRPGGAPDANEADPAAAAVQELGGGGVNVTPREGTTPGEAPEANVEEPWWARLRRDLEAAGFSQEEISSAIQQEARARTRRESAPAPEAPEGPAFEFPIIEAFEGLTEDQSTPEFLEQLRSEVAGVGGGIPSMRLNLGLAEGLGFSPGSLERLRTLAGDEDSVELAVVPRTETDPLEGTTTRYFFADPETGTILESAGSLFFNPATGTTERQAGEGVEVPLGAELAEEFDVLREAAVARAQATDADTLALRNQVLVSQIQAVQDAINRAADFANEQLLQQGRLEAEAAEGERQRTFLDQQREANEDFQIRLEGIRNDNALMRDAINQAAEDARLSKELAFRFGSLEEAAAQRELERSLRIREVQLQEQSQLISLLGVLGAHPQLRGLIQSLGLFEGFEIEGAPFNVADFFNAEVPLNLLPNAQEFARMSPSMQESTLNDLAGRFGVSPEIIAVSIRNNAPGGTRRLT